MSNQSQKPTFPELEKIDPAQNNAIVQFIEFLTEEGYNVMRRAKPGNRHRDYVPTCDGEIEELILRFFDADPAQVEKERRQLLEYITQQSE